MKKVLNIVAILLIVGGGVWVLQGVNILPRSFMTGQIEWAIYGGLAILLGQDCCFLLTDGEFDEICL